MVDFALVCIETGDIWDICTEGSESSNMYCNDNLTSLSCKSGSDYQEALWHRVSKTHLFMDGDATHSFCSSAIFSLDDPFCLIFIKLCAHNDSLERTILAQFKGPVDMIEITLQFCPVGIVGTPLNASSTISTIFATYSLKQSLLSSPCRLRESPTHR